MRWTLIGLTRNGHKKRFRTAHSKYFWTYVQNWSNLHHFREKAMFQIWHVSANWDPIFKIIYGNFDAIVCFMEKEYACMKFPLILLKIRFELAEICYIRALRNLRKWRDFYHFWTYVQNIFQRVVLNLFLCPLLGV